MTTPKFTPGPYRWIAHVNYPATDLVAADGTVILQIYESHGGGDMPDDEEARLIAAAPDMYEACEYALEYITNIERSYEITLAAGVKLRAALAKANPDA